MATDRTHVWIARFDSSDRWLEYMKEDDSEDDDELPLNEFAADQGETWYNHDWIEGNFSEQTVSGPMGAQVQTLLSGFSYASSYMDAVVADAIRISLTGVNAVIGISSDEISSPRSVVGNGYDLRFVGTYERSLPPPRFDPAATELNLRDQQLTAVPPEVFELTDLVELSLANNALTKVPDEIGRLRKLEVIYLYDNQLTALPGSLFTLPKLRKVKANDNAIRSLPTTIGEADNLVSLTVCDNRVTRLPDEIGNLSQLELLDIGGNELRELPAAIGRLRRLTTLRCGATEIRRLPDEITALAISKQLHLPQSFDVEAQSPAVQTWLADR